MESVLNVICSRAESLEGRPIDCNLLDELLSTKYLHRQNEVRAETDPDKQADLKQTMPILLPSCQCRGAKGKSNVIKHTGLIAIDIDEKDNMHIQNFYELKEQFCKMANVAYCGLSVRGKGYFLLIPIGFPDKHELHFKFMEQYFAASGIKIDPVGININRLRYYSYDPQAYFNHKAKPSRNLFVAPVVLPKPVYQKTFDADSKPVWEQYNEGQFFIEVLENQGWKIVGKKGYKIYFTRPGKDAGLSAEYDSTKNVFYVFTSNGYPFKGATGYNPFGIYTLLNHNGDYSKAAKSLLPPGKAYFKAQQSKKDCSKGIAQTPIPKPDINKLVNNPQPLPAKHPEPILPEQPTCYTIGQLTAIAIKQATKIKVPKEKYFKVWAEGMGTILKQSNITEQQFLNHIKN